MKTLVLLVLSFFVVAFALAQPKTPAKKHQTHRKYKPDYNDRMFADPFAIDTFKCFFEPMPEFPGGMDSLKRYISKNLVYPGTSSDIDVEGNVILRFIITPTGAVDSIKIVRSLYPDLDKEAIRVISTMPRWVPAKNQKQNIWWTMPVTFKLD